MKSEWQWKFHFVSSTFVGANFNTEESMNRFNETRQINRFHRFRAHIVQPAVYESELFIGECNFRGNKFTKTHLDKCLKTRLLGQSKEGIYFLSDKFSADTIFRWTKFFDGQNFRHQVEISAVLSDEIFSSVSDFPIQFAQETHVLT